MPTPVARVCFLATLVSLACTLVHAQSQGGAFQGARVGSNKPRKEGVFIGLRSADLGNSRQKNAQQDDTLVAAIASAQVSSDPERAPGGPVSVGFEGGVSGGVAQGGPAMFGGSTNPIEAFPTETRTAPIDVSKKLNTAIQNSDIAGAVELLTREDDVHELARGLKFNGSNRQQFIKKTASRMPDGDVITMKSIAKAVLDTRDAQKFATVMVLSTLDERREDLERKLVQVLRDRELMHAILFADPAKQFVPGEDKVLATSPRLRQSSKDGSSTGDSSQFQLDDLGQQRLMCNGCSPVNSFVCVHCWANKACSQFGWCPK